MSAILPFLFINAIRSVRILLEITTAPVRKDSTL